MRILDRKPPLTHRLLGIAAILLVSSVVLLFDVWPHHPSTLRGWALFVALGAPGYLAAEALVEHLLTRGRGR